MIFDCEAFNRSFEHVTSFADSKMKLIQEIQKKSESKGRVDDKWIIIIIIIIIKKKAPPPS